MQQRYYDPTAGRFLSVDPVTTDAKTGGHFNRYAYADNNPYKYTDPDGRSPVHAGLKALDLAVSAVEIMSAFHSGGAGAGIRATAEALLSVPGARTGAAIMRGLDRLGDASKVSTKTVGRHMSPQELENMRSTGRVQEGSGGQTRVADPANSNTYRNPPKGDVYVEFDVPANRVLPHSEGTGRIPGPNSPDARVAGRNPKDYEMPPAKNIRVPSEK